MSELDVFIDRVGKYAQSVYDKYKILPSLCIAQALLESNKADYRKGLWKPSGLASDCHNYFGMKWSEGCGCAYKEYRTREQRKDGTYYEVIARFRKYDTLEQGIEGYFKFLQYKRYANLKGVTDYKKACDLIRQDGWATSLTYTQNLIKRIEDLQLYRYDMVQVKYYVAYKGNTRSIVQALESIGVDSSFDNRKRIAIRNCINGYKGTEVENLLLLEKLSKGVLIKP